MSGTNRIILSAIQKSGASESALTSALDNANEVAARKEKTGK